MKKKDVEYEQLGRCLKGLAHDLRLKIIYFLADGEKTVSEIEQYTGRSQSNISQHLILMRDKNILISRKDANQIYYSLKDARILSIIRQLCEILANK
ncbi:MAG: ArsR/SmtB family transcription factor [bacterium]